MNLFSVATHLASSSRPPETRNLGLPPAAAPPPGPRGKRLRRKRRKPSTSRRLPGKSDFPGRFPSDEIANPIGRCESWRRWPQSFQAPTMVSLTVNLIGSQLMEVGGVFRPRRRCRGDDWVWPRLGQENRLA